MNALLVVAAVVAPVLVLAATAVGRAHGYRIPYSVALPGSLAAGIAVAAAGGIVGLEQALTALVVLGFAVAVGFVRYLDRPGGRWARHVRSRLLVGVPWGSIISISIVLASYLFLQNGLQHPYDPLSIPFTSWSYLYPLGVVTAPFAHAGLGHLTGNLVGTLTLAPLAEYAFSHFPTRRGSSSFGSWRTNPYLRAFVFFPLGVVLVALATSVFSWGAIIGFSGVVFAYAGFAVVRYPLATVVALSARGLVSTVYYALRDPVVVGSASPSYGPPWWVGIAVQGHLLGLFLGAVLGVFVLARRRDRPSAGRVFAGVLLLGFSLALYALWWYRGPSTYVMYRGLGVLLVVGVAVLFASAVRARAVPLVKGVTRRQIAVAAAVLPLLTMAMVAVPVNLTTVGATDAPADAIEVRDYTVYYAEDVPNKRVSAIDIDALNETTLVNASGVIVTNPSRHIWTEAVSTGSLAYWGEQTVRIGGVDWEATVDARRRGWSAVGGDTAYNVFLRPPDGEWTAVFASDPATASPTIAGRNLTIVPVNGQFQIRVTAANRTLAEAPFPAKNATPTVGGLTLNRTDGTLVATYNETRVTVATKETYE